MNVRKGLERRASRALGAVGLEVSRRGDAGPDRGFEPIREDDVLPLDQAGYEKLWAAYREHPLAAVSGHIWDQGTDAASGVPDVDVRTVRGDNAYVWQSRLHDSGTFALGALWAEHADRHGLLTRMHEDGAFGANCVTVDGRLWSRDLIDSTLEISFLLEHLPEGSLESMQIVDLGAGYGRLLHRLADVTTGTRLAGVDGVALSTAIARAYVEYRGLTERVSILDLEQADADDLRIDLATNIHSFSEMSIEAVGWWLDWLVRHGTSWLFVVPNVVGPALNDGTPLTPLLRERGFELVVERPKYTDPLVAAHAPYPAQHYLYRRA